MPAGRPSEYNPLVAEKLCEEIASGGNINALAGTGCYPSQPTIYKWMRDNEGFLKDILKARAIRAFARVERVDLMKQGVLDGTVDRAVAETVFRMEAWQAARESTKYFGDKIEIDQTVTQKPADVDWTGVDSEDVQTARDILARVTSPKPSVDKAKLNGQTKH